MSFASHDLMPPSRSHDVVSLVSLHSRAWHVLHWPREVADICDSRLGQSLDHSTPSVGLGVVNLGIWETAEYQAPSFSSQLKMVLTGIVHAHDDGWLVTRETM